jgi:MoaA/NifB/PqqE/SkfB family radical SAM enzyme
MDYDAAKQIGEENSLQGLILQFPGCQKPLLLQMVGEIAGWTTTLLREEIQAARKNVLRLVAIMLTGACNMDCSICYVDRKKSQEEIGWKETEQLLEQARTMGATTIYTAGVGEPTLDRRFWQIAEYARLHNMEWIFFTNGLTINKKMAARLATYPVNIWIKFWSTDPDIFFAMCRPNTSPEKFRNHFAGIDFRGKRLFIPNSLRLLLDAGILPERLGVQTVPAKINFDDVLTNIIPFAYETGLRMYVEPIIHSGRYAYDHFWDLTVEQEAQVQPYYVRQNCTRRIYKVVIDHEGVLRPAQAMGVEELHSIGIEKEEMKLAAKGAVINGLEELRFRHPKHRAKLLDLRWRAGCMCNRFAGDKQYQGKLRVLY